MTCEEALAAGLISDKKIYKKRNAFSGSELDQCTMHWYDRYIEEYYEMCWNSDECHGACEHCDEFRDVL